MKLMAMHDSRSLGLRQILSLVLVGMFVLCSNVNGGLATVKSKRWKLPPDKRVKVFVDDSVPPPILPCDVSKASTRCVIKEAIKLWNQAAFGIIEYEEVGAKPESGPYVLIRLNKSTDPIQPPYTVGTGQSEPRENVIVVGDDMYTQLIVHELGHRAGLEHEHRRCDREAYIDIAFGTKLKDWFLGQYKTICDANKAVPHGDYDFRSIMHYDNWDGNWTPTTDGDLLLKRQNIDAHKVGTTKTLSIGDVETLFDLYCDQPGDCQVMTPIQNTVGDKPLGFGSRHRKRGVSVPRP